MLVEYAKEDLGFAKESGQIAIAQTLVGLIDINYENGLFQAYNNRNEQLTYTINEAKMINWLITKYDVSEIEINN
jgi:hypothetical protein